MKLVVDLEDVWTGYEDEAGSVAQLIRDEIRFAVKNEVKKLIRAHDVTLKKTVEKAMARYLTNIPSAEDLIRLANDTVSTSDRAKHWKVLKGE